MWRNLNYETRAGQPPVDSQRRHPFLTVLVFALGVLSIPVIILFGIGVQWIYTDTHITFKNTVALTNRTTLPITDAGFFSIASERVGSIGNVGVGQTRSKQLVYGENDCPEGFYFDQGGETFYVPLARDYGVEDGSTYDITIAAGKLTAKCINHRGATTTFVQVPSTQPLSYKR